MTLEDRARIFVVGNSGAGKSTLAMALATAVIEGCYADLVQALATEGDHFIWLDLSVDDCIANAKARPWEPHKWPSAEAQDAFLPNLLAFIATYPDSEGPTGRRAHAALFDAFVGTKEKHIERPARR